MPSTVTRVFSDLHFGDHASRVRQLAQIRPLVAGISHLVLNGDTLDTRPGPRPDHTSECRADVAAFLRHEVPVTSVLTGNHDADISELHHLDLAGGSVFATHGDIFFDDIVPWSHDAAMIRRKIAAELSRLPTAHRHELGHRFAVFRRVAASVPQRHQSERNKLKYLLHFFADTVWPPTRIVRVVQAWRLAPAAAATLSRRHRPKAKFVLCGHTHRPGIWTLPDGVRVVNTGSFCPPLGGLVVDLTPEQLVVRRTVLRRGEFHAGERIAEFPLAAF